MQEFDKWAVECGKPLFRAGYIASVRKNPGYFNESMAETIQSHGGFANGHIGGWSDLESAKACMEAMGRPCPDEAPVSVVMPRNFQVNRSSIWKQSTSRLVVGPGWIAFDNGLHGTARLCAMAPLDGPGLATPFMFGVAFGDMMKPPTFRVHAAHGSWDGAVLVEKTQKGPRQGHTFLVAPISPTAQREWIASFPFDLPEVEAEVSEAA